jgi:glycogen synthase
MIPIRHTVIAGYYPPPFAGEPIHVKQLAALVRSKGLSVEIVNLNHRADASTEYSRATGPLNFALLLWSRLRRSSLLHLHTNGHGHKSWLLILGSGLMARVRRARTILTLHSGLLPRYLALCGRARRLVARLALGSFNRIICVNRDIEAALTALGVASTRLEVIPAYLPSADYCELPESDRLFLQRRWPVLLAVAGGDKDPEDGLLVVVHALQAAVQAFPRIGAVFVGWQVGPRTIPLISELSLDRYALCLGEVPHERCLALMRASDVVVRSTFADGDAITVREALDIGVPVVASDVVPRPAGTVLFLTGDPVDLSRNLTQVIEQGAPRQKAERSEGYLIADDLWRVYCEVGDLPRGPGVGPILQNQAPRARESTGSFP